MLELILVILSIPFVVVFFILWLFILIAGLGGEGYDQDQDL